MEQKTRLSRQERVLEIVEKNTRAVLDISSDDAEPVHAGMIADALQIDRSNVARELNGLFREGLVIKFQGKPTRYVSRSILTERYPSVFFPSTMPKETNLKKYVVSHSEDTGTAPVIQGHSLDNMLGVYGSLQSAILQARAAVLYPSNRLHCLITGSVGVGKGLFAEQMFAYAVTKKVLPEDAPFISVNCKEHSHTPQLLLTQLFGAGREMSPNRDKSRKGLIEKAAGGFLVLYNLEDMPASVQDVLNLLLEKNIYSRIGEASVTRTGNAFIIGISTENADSPTMQALSQRFSVHIHLPDLKERGISELTELLIDTFQQESITTGICFKVSCDVFSCFLKDSYPGNLGELSSTVRTACSLAYLEYSSAPTVPKIMEIRFRHLPSESLNTIQDDPKKNQLIQEMLAQLDFGYFLFSPSGFTADHYAGSQFIELLHSYGSLARSGDNRSMPLSIAREYLKNYLSKNARSNIENLIVLPEFFPSYLLEAIQSVLPGDPVFQSFVKEPNEMYRLLCCLSGAVSHQLTSIPRSDFILDSLRKLCQEETVIAEQLQQQMQREQFAAFSNSELCYIIACLNTARQRNCSGQVPIILVCRGKNVAHDYATYVNEALGTTIVYGIPYQESMAFGELLDHVTDLANKIDVGKGILVAVDMPPLTSLGEHIEDSTGIPTALISDITLSGLLKVSTSALRDNLSLEMLVREANHMAEAPESESASFLDRAINEVLAPSLAFLDCKKAETVLTHALKEILNSLHLVWSTEIAIKFIFHCSHMIERLMHGECLPYNHLKAFVNREQELMNTLECCMQYPAEMFGIFIPSSELAYIAEIFLDYIR